MTRVILMLIFFVLCNTGGELAMSYGVKQVGEPPGAGGSEQPQFAGVRLASQELQHRPRILAGQPLRLGHAMPLFLERHS